MSNFSNKSHVLILVQNLPVPFDRRVWLEASTLRDEGYLVSVICPATSAYPRLRETVEGIDIYRFPLRWEGRGKVGIVLEYVWSLLFIFSMTTLLSLRRRVDAVHFCNPPDLLFLCALPAKWIWRSKLIFDQHDLCPEVWETKSQGSNTIILNLLKFFERASYKISDIVISTNESYRKIAISRGFKDESSVFVVRSAPKKSFMNDITIPARDCSTTIRLVYLGTMGSQEGIDLLLEAVQILRNRNSDLEINLDLIGDGPEKRQLEQKSKLLGLEDIAKFHGRVSDTTLRDLVSSADIALNPDRPSPFNTLSSMNKIVEYMALGVPIVQFHSIEGEYTARAASVYVYEPTPSALADAIENLRLGQRERQKMKEFCQLRFRELCWEIQAQTFAKIYRNLLNDSI
jgi:glycosyltransferase involved in cell wall biosynthesis